MPQIEGTSRHQMQIFALEQAIAADNPVRVIDAFVSTLSLEKLGFLIKGEGDEGRPAYAAEMLLRLYLYGYLNRIRSSRQLEKACRRNIELWWLLNKQCRGQCRTSEGQQREIPAKAGYSGAPLRHHKAWLGVQLHAAEG